MSVHDEMKNAQERAYQAGFRDGKEFAYTTVKLFVEIELDRLSDINSLEAKAEERAMNRIAALIESKVSPSSEGINTKKEG